MKQEPAVVVSPYLRQVFTSAIEGKRLTFMDFSKAADVSYNYARRAAQGTVIPGADVLARMCQAMGLDFYEVQNAVNEEQGRDAVIMVDLTPTSTAAPTPEPAPVNVESTFESAMEESLLYHFRQLSSMDRIRVHQAVSLLVFGIDKIMP